MTILIRKEKTAQGKIRKPPPLRETSVDKVSFYDREFYCAGLKAIKDLFDTRLGTLRSFAFWANAGFKHHEYFKWMSIMVAVSKTWKQRLKLESCVPFEFIEKLINVKNINHKSIYNTLRKKQSHVSY